MTSSTRHRRFIQLAATLLCGLGFVACQEAREDPEDLVIYFCKGTRVSSFNSVKCVREGPQGQELVCPVDPPDCARETSIRSMYCDRRSACEAREPSVCNDKSQYDYDQTCEQLNSERDACLQAWKATCEGYRIGGVLAGCVASWLPSPCNENVGPEFVESNQCKVVCGDQ